MIWATVSSQSCFCWLYRASPSSTAKNLINLILVLAIWWWIEIIDDRWIDRWWWIDWWWVMITDKILTNPKNLIQRKFISQRYLGCCMGKENPVRGYRSAPGETGYFLPLAWWQWMWREVGRCQPAHVVGLGRRQLSGPSQHRPRKEIWGRNKFQLVAD